MPVVNIYFKKQDENFRFQGVVNELKNFLSKELSGSSIKLSPSEISVRMVNQLNTDGLIGDIEIDLSVHSFSERVEKQDEICRNVRNFLQEKDFKNVKVWLKLSELGHSF